ncbi:cytochrome P450 [Zalerion maritima]|uniref:Cytochrome P450 n=1 Tax=Zalerion maritima TaxID=339359 RepID=A0AAD5RK52_9PEZI|nr:cytochrome P450 [Zalerion maritima]
MIPVGLQLLLIPIILMGAVYSVLLTPPRHPKNIPAVPFWVTLLPFFFDIDQEETYRKYIEQPLTEHGAVKMFFGARWNVLVARPELMQRVFRDEELFRKSGNHEKIPHSVLAEFLGDNIISASAEKWRTYRSVIKPALQRPFDSDIVERNTDNLCDLFAATQKKSPVVPVQELLQRFTIANTAQCIFDADFKSLADSTTISSLQGAVKREIFKPIFMSFPFLDSLPFPSRLAARRKAGEFYETLQKALLGSKALDAEKVSSRLVEAKNNGTLTPRQFRDNLMVLFVASQENPQLALISTLYLLAKHPQQQAVVRAELKQAREENIPLDQLPRLTATLLECLRLFPPISQLVNRRTTAPAALGPDSIIPEETYVGYYSYATNRDIGFWGKDSKEFVPERWGGEMDKIQSNLRKSKSKAAFITFHGGRRACLGEKFAMLELRTAVAGVLQRFELSLPRGVEAGPLYPRALKLNFQELEK